MSIKVILHSYYFSSSESAPTEKLKTFFWTKHKTGAANYMLRWQTGATLG